MTTVRLLPIVVMATSALLALKTVGLVTGGGYTLSGASLAFAQEEGSTAEQSIAIGESPVGAELDFGYSQDQLDAAEAAARSLFSDGGANSADNVLYELDGAGQPVPFGEGGGTRLVIEERLGERRAQLDALEDELETRLALVEAAERRVEERLAELQEVEARINALVDTQETEEAEQFQRLVSMYENMRPAEAAAIFDDLDMGILTRVGQQMNPRRLGPIIARMAPAKAQQLTVRLASTEAGYDPASAAEAHTELPQIVGQ